MSGFRNGIYGASAFALAAAVMLVAPLAPVSAQNAAHPWLDPTLAAAAKAEGTLIVYSSTNEQEGLPLFKIFEEATGIKVEYIRNADSPLMSRVAIEYRANQKSWDLFHTTTVNKLPPQMLAQFEVPEVKNIAPEGRDPGKRWYAVYANYNSPAYNTQKVKASELPKTYEDLARRKEWAGKVAIDGTDNVWLKAMLDYYGKEKGTQIVKDLVATLQPVVTDGHLAMARAVGAGEYALALNQFVNLSENVKIAGSPIEVFPLDPVALFFGEVGISALAPHPNAARLAANFMLSQECQQFLAKFGRIPTRADVASNPPGIVDLMQTKNVVTELLSPEEERTWQRQFDSLFKAR
ncbi:MAG TPA: extracellular solute-binding protein [Xanthobacteraceae bacterium]|nr:extracellular solute-binding protein [Xanthobacteraceae bacterium]